MPLVCEESLDKDVRLGLWKIDESKDEFFDSYPFLLSQKDYILESYKSDRRVREVLAVRALIHSMFGSGVVLSHDDRGCPHLSNGVNIGISHTSGYAAIIVSPVRRVAVDVEYFSDRVERVASRYIRNDEQAYALLSKLLHWCTKETLYKLYPEDELGFEEMQLLSINGNDVKGIITAKNILRNSLVEVRYSVSDRYVLTYSSLPCSET